MGSDTHSVLPGGKSEWQRAEQAIDRLIAAHQGLMRDDATETGTAPQQPASAAPAAPLPAAGPLQSRWPTIVLLAALWLSIALVVSAAFLSIAMLL